MAGSGQEEKPDRRGPAQTSIAVHPSLVYNTAMQRLELKPTHKPVQSYCAAQRDNAQHE
jgi:hypothetical protein